jgi:hypothetical protein
MVSNQFRGVCGRAQARAFCQKSSVASDNSVAIAAWMMAAAMIVLPAPVGATRIMRRLASPLIGLGIDVFVLDPQSNPNARELTDDEVKQHDEFINEASNALRSVPETMRGKANKLPEVPVLMKNDS